MSELSKALSSIVIDEKQWRFSDVRVDIPPLGLGSDAMNRHTQYSNAVATLSIGALVSRGICFTLGVGNSMVCEAAHEVVRVLSGRSVDDLLHGPGGLYGSLVDSSQLRWLSPYAGVPMMAAGLIFNTLLDYASQRCGIPAWEYLARLPSDTIFKLIDTRHLGTQNEVRGLVNMLDKSVDVVTERCEELRECKIVAYRTSWIGFSTGEIVSQLEKAAGENGISTFKVKIGPDLTHGVEMVQQLFDRFGTSFMLAVDANQSLSYEGALDWLVQLSRFGVLWLEEPFAPDNVHLFSRLCKERDARGLQTRIASGENCPNTHIAAELMRSNLDIFQPDPCRMMGLADCLITAALARQSGASYIPHAGGLGLDELAPQIQFLNLARVDTDRSPLDSLVENVGFTAKFFATPCLPEGGYVNAPKTSGLSVFYQDSIEHLLQDFRQGPIWLEP